MPVHDGGEDQFELEPCYRSSRGETYEAGEEVFVRGVGGRFLGIGTFAGQLVLADSSGREFPIPVLEVQDMLLSGGQVGLWSTDPTLIEEHRNEATYPIGIYQAELAEVDRAISDAHASAMGIRLD